MPHFASKSGFTLAELLIALALLGVIAAFTIPKVLQASAEQEKVAKLRETVSTLEQAWYNAKATNSVYTGSALNYLGDTIAPQLNTARITNAFSTDPGEALNGVVPLHLCSAYRGYFVLQNGVVVTGLYYISYSPTTLSRPTQTFNSFVCIDVNGKAPPNAIGQDIFFGNFNPWGDFDVAMGGVYQPTQNGKNFHWGNTSAIIYDADGVNYGIIANGRVGTWLAQ